MPYRFIDFLCKLCYTTVNQVVMEKKGTWESHNSCENRGSDKSLFTMKTLQDIIQRCHKQHNALLRQRKTIVTPALYKGIPYHFKVYCARQYPVLLDDLERADISFMPIGHAPENDRGPKDFGGDRFLRRQGIQDWRYKRWRASWGIQIYTGIPSEHRGARWHDLDFKYEAICAAPDAVLTCIEALFRTTTNPLLTLTKSGGLRFSCRVPDYLHPNTDTARFYVYKHRPTSENPHHRDVYLEIRGENGYSRWDSRYEILLGNLLDPPIVAKEILFRPIDALQDALHEPEPFGERRPETVTEDTTAVPLSLDSPYLDLAKAAFLKRGFSYVQEDGGFHHWRFKDRNRNDQYVSLWQDQEIVWVRASTPDTGLPTRAVPITDIWNDTGIPSPTSGTGLPISDKMLAVREANLSPLAIKRLPPMLHRRKAPKKVYQTLDENTKHMQGIFDKKARILGVISDTVPKSDDVVEAYLRKGGVTCLNVTGSSLTEAVEERYHARNLPSFARWRPRMYRWEQVKEIPVNERMEAPFQRGNPCEDPERCKALEDKGGDPLESICPGCQVYTECQQRGYLSQPLTLRHAKAQILPTHQIFLDPKHAALLELILEPADAPERICIIDYSQIEVNQLFLECSVSKNVLAEWLADWRGNALGNFAQALLHALETQNQPTDSAIRQVRAVVEAFQQHEAVLIRQMCHVNVPGKVVERSAVDAETGAELARFSIAFDGGASAYIPLNANAEDKLRAHGLTCFRVDAFTPNEEIKIPMRIEQAIELGVLDTTTVQEIRKFPTVSKNPNWTFWHQLKLFFLHYTRDIDAPMRWDDETLRFWIPPMLHPNVRRLLLIAPTFSERHIRKTFRGENIEIVDPGPIAWLPGNQVFQIRTGLHSLYTISNYDSNWDVFALSKIGERFLFGIRAEIEKDSGVKHAIIINYSITKELSDIAKKENVCFLTNFKDFHTMDTGFQEAEVVWIIGMPSWPEHAIWRHAQMLFGDDDKPLSYEGEIEDIHYKDKRIKEVHHQNAVDLLTQIIGRVGLNCQKRKKVVLLTSLELPNITDRPETLLFDWEDFEIAGGLDKLPEVIATRQRFETERDNLTAESNRQEVERVLGCSTRMANYVLQRLRGGNIPRVSFQEQILTLLADGEKRKSEITAAIGSSPQSVGNELKRLVDIGEIVKVQRGVYALPETSS